LITIDRIVDAVYADISRKIGHVPHAMDTEADPCCDEQDDEEKHDAQYGKEPPGAAIPLGELVGDLRESIREAAALRRRVEFGAQQLAYGDVQRGGEPGQLPGIGDGIAVFPFGNSLANDMEAGGKVSLRQATALAEALDVFVKHGKIPFLFYFLFYYIDGRREKQATQNNILLFPV